MLGRWALGLGASALLHVCAAGLYLATQSLDAPPDQPKPQSRMQLDTVTAPRQRAEAQDPSSTDAAEAETEGTRVDGGPVAQSSATAIAPNVTYAGAASVKGARLPESTALGEVVKSSEAQVDAVSAAALQAAPVPETSARPTQASEPTLDSTSVEASAAPATKLANLSPDMASLPEVADAGLSLAGQLPAGTALSGEAPSGSRADSLSIASNVAAPEALASTTLAAKPALIEEATEAAVRPATQLANLRPDIASLPEVANVGVSLAGQLPSGTALSGESPTGRRADSLSFASEIAAAQNAAVQQAIKTEPEEDGAVLASASGETVADVAPDVDVAATAALPATRTKASTALRFGDRLVTDPEALATIAAFMEPGAPEAQSVRDDLSGMLTGVDCARVSATYLPETGALELRGHIPDPALQEPLLEALSAQVGDGIPVTANLLHLPAPQCGALTGIANLGLPQSTDQFTNARLIGASAHARAYDYSEGQRLQFDLAGPDYDAYVYVDYFNADGDVIHLVPNETVPLEQILAKATFGIGRAEADKPSLDITIGPPFGQEIAVAFASSVRLYAELRPIVEPAAPYLADLKNRIAEARAAHSDFKGEWVYFFITTSPASQ